MGKGEGVDDTTRRAEIGEVIGGVYSAASERLRERFGGKESVGVQVVDGDGAVERGGEDSDRGGGATGGEEGEAGDGESVWSPRAAEKRK
jgi:hypothetical protein